MTWLRLVPPKAIAAVIGIVLVMAASCWVAWAWQANSYQAQIAGITESYANERRYQAEANAAAQNRLIAERSALEKRLATLDQSSTERLSHAQQENDRLQRLYSSADDERRRLRIEVRVARSDSVVSSATGAGSMGYAASVELSAAAGSAVWDIRRGMKQDAEKIAYLQGYICEIQPDAPGCETATKEQ